MASIDTQPEIQWWMRPYLLEFLVQAHEEFSLLPETLFLTINILDRYCSKIVVHKKSYQLVGCAAMRIAAKFGDKKVCVPTIKDLQALCVGLYEKKLFVQMERHVLKALGWVIGHPTVDSFLQMVLQQVSRDPEVKSSYDPEVESMARYLAEIAFFHKDFVSVRPSVMARTAYALALHILGRKLRHSYWGSIYDKIVWDSLSQHLDCPPPVLTLKYSTIEHLRVANTLGKFMACPTAMTKKKRKEEKRTAGRGKSVRMDNNGTNQKPYTIEQRRCIKRMRQNATPLDKALKKHKRPTRHTEKSKKKCLIPSLELP